MIRIDLGKDALTKGKAKKSFLPKIDVPPELARHLEFLRGRTGNLLFAGVGAAIACIFPLAFSQYESVVKREHEESVMNFRQKAAALDEEIKKFEPFEREKNGYEEQKRLVQARLTAIQSLLGARSTSVNVLDTIGQALPNRTWISSLEVNFTDTGNVAMSGYAYVNDEVSDLLEKLGDSLYLSDVSLQDLSSTTVQNVEVKGFNLTAKAVLSRTLSSTPPAK